MAKTIHLGPWRCRVVVTVHKKEFQRWMREFRKDPEYEVGDAAGLHWFNETGVSYVGIFDGNINTLTHEMAHAALHISNYLGLGNLYQSQEQFCYLIGHLVEEGAATVMKGK